MNHTIIAHAKIWIATAGIMFLTGCTTRDRQSDVYSVGLLSSTPRMKAVVAVMDFQNKSGFSGKWNLGDGMAELLNAELLESSRVIVLERQNLRDVIDEINLQDNDLFRPEGRVERGRLKNAQFLIRGTVTDFTVTDDVSGWFSTDAFKLRAGSSRARVAIAVRVYDVENGEVITTVKADAEASTGGFGGAVKYQEVAFGGDSYFRTPLGKATEKAIAKAVKKILVALPARDWQPRVAETRGDIAYINGGQNVGIKVGQLYIIRESGRPITDPATGTVLDIIPGDVLGKLEITTVNETAAQARITEGRATRGDFLEPVK